MTIYPSTVHNTLRPIDIANAFTPPISIEEIEYIIIDYIYNIPIGLDVIFAGNTIELDDIYYPNDSSTWLKHTDPILIGDIEIVRQIEGTNELDAILKVNVKLFNCEICDISIIVDLIYDGCVSCFTTTTTTQGTTTTTTEGTTTTTTTTEGTTTTTTEGTTTTTTTTTRGPIPCDTDTADAECGYPITNTVILGDILGTVALEYDSPISPIRFIVNYNGIDVIDTGYIGNIGYDYGGDDRTTFTNNLTGLIDPITTITYPDFVNYPDDGYPRVTSANPILYFDKDNVLYFATIYIYSPNNTYCYWAFNLNCPIPTTTTTSTSTSTSTTTTTTQGTTTTTTTEPFIDTKFKILSSAFYPCCNDPDHPYPYTVDIFDPQFVAGYYESVAYDEIESIEIITVSIPDGLELKHNNVTLSTGNVLVPLTEYEWVDGHVEITRITEGIGTSEYLRAVVVFKITLIGGYAPSDELTANLEFRGCSSNCLEPFYLNSSHEFGGGCCPVTQNAYIPYYVGHDFYYPPEPTWEDVEYIIITNDSTHTNTFDDGIKITFDGINNIQVGDTFYPNTIVDWVLNGNVGTIKLIRTIQGINELSGTIFFKIKLFEHPLSNHIVGTRLAIYECIDCGSTTTTTQGTTTTTTQGTTTTTTTLGPIDAISYYQPCCGLTYPLIYNYIFMPDFVANSYTTQNYFDIDYVEITYIDKEYGLDITCGGNSVIASNEQPFILHQSDGFTWREGEFGIIRTNEGYDDLLATINFKIKLFGEPITQIMIGYLFFKGCRTCPSTTTTTTTTAPQIWPCPYGLNSRAEIYEERYVNIGTGDGLVSFQYSGINPNHHTDTLSSNIEIIITVDNVEIFNSSNPLQRQIGRDIDNNIVYNYIIDTYYIFSPTQPRIIKITSNDPLVEGYIYNISCMVPFITYDAVCHNIEYWEDMSNSTNRIQIYLGTETGFVTGKLFLQTKYSSNAKYKFTLSIDNHDILSSYWSSPTVQTEFGGDFYLKKGCFFNFGFSKNSDMGNYATFFIESDNVDSEEDKLIYLQVYCPILDFYYDISALISYLSTYGTYVPRKGYLEYMDEDQNTQYLNFDDRIYAPRLSQGTYLLKFFDCANKNSLINSLNADSLHPPIIHGIGLVSYRTPCTSRKQKNLSFRFSNLVNYFEYEDCNGAIKTIYIDYGYEESGRYEISDCVDTKTIRAYNFRNTPDYLPTEVLSIFEANGYLITWTIENGEDCSGDPCPSTTTSTSTTTTTLAPTTTTTTILPLNFDISFACVDMSITVNVNNFIGGSGGYSASTTYFTSEAEALDNTDWTVCSDRSYGVEYLAQTVWVIIKDSIGNLKAKSVYTDCTPP